MGKHNIFLAVRHGESEANVASIVVSHPDNGVPLYGLTERGREQARGAAARVQEVMREHPAHRVVIVHSDFRRASETAREIEPVIMPRGGEVCTDERLRERFFGARRELGPGTTYAEVWSCDIESADRPEEGGAETVRAVADRTTAVVRDLNGRLDRAIVLLVSHGDTLTILLTAAQGEDLRRHKSLPHLENAGVRRLASLDFLDE